METPGVVSVICNWSALVYEPPSRLKTGVVASSCSRVVFEVPLRVAVSVAVGDVPAEVRVT